MKLKRCFFVIIWKYKRKQHKVSSVSHAWLIMLQIQMADDHKFTLVLPVIPS